MNRLAVILPYYKREEITSLCFKHLLKQSKKFKFDVFVSGDNLGILPKEFKVIECDNLPLGNKLNTLIQSTKDYDGVVVMGSDDFVSDSVWKLYQTINVSEPVFYGFDNCHIYSCHNGKLGTDFAYTKSGNTIGVARLWTKPTLELMNYTLYSSHKNSGLDSDSKSRMLAKGIKEVFLSYDGHFILDVKQGYNITNPAIVNTSETFHDPIMIVSELGVIGNEILNLKACEVMVVKNKVSREDRRLIKLNRRKK